MAGSSDVFDCGFVTSSNASKVAMLGVNPQTLTDHGAVSEPVAQEMAEGALTRSGAGLAVAITGIAGPGGGSLHKPVGTVWLAWGTRWGGVQAELLSLSGDRRAIRHAAVIEALGRVIGVCPEWPIDASCDGG
jgi:nicotinamide-nucleotide amidase